MIIMGIDIGTHRTGVAICDKTEFLASPLQTLKITDEQELVDKIIELANENKAQMIVIGHPINMNGSRGERAIACEEIANRLKEKSNLKVELWDERKSTKQAERYLNYANVRKRSKKKVIDEVAATIILDSFLTFRKSKNKGC